MCKVSVIIPCYNSGRFLLEAINSVKNQTFSDWEIIVVDDGSTDKETKDILCNLQEDRSLKIIHQINKGPSQARNAGISLARGDLILPLDADDTISPCYMEEAVPLFDKEKNLGIVYCRAKKFGKECGEWVLPDFSPRRMAYSNVIFVSAFFKKSDWKLVGGYPIYAKDGLEDYAFWLRILSLKREVYKINKILFNYRIVDNGRTASLNNDKKKLISIYARVFRENIDFFYNNAEGIYQYRSNSFSDEEIDNLKQNFLKQISKKDEMFYNLKQKYTKQFFKENDIINELRNRIFCIENSNYYKFAKYYYKLRDRMLPVGTKRRILVKKIFNTSVFYYKKFYHLCKVWTHHSIESNITSNKNDEYFYTNDASIEKRVSKFIPDDTIIDIIIPVYNALYFTKKCIEGVFKNTDIDYRLIIIDDCSTDKGTKDFLNSIRNVKKINHLKELLVLENTDNLGFVGSVNRGFTFVRHHVVLLNTDTEVPPCWLKRIIWPFFCGKKISTVTPFSNSATICSFPNFLVNNNLPKGLDLLEIDSIFKNYGEQNYIEIPTGVGFAMAINYDCLQEVGVFDPIYGKGYGEENDFCRRATLKGWINVQVLDLFIYHKHGASFETRKDISREKRIASNLAILSHRFPDYNNLVQEYISRDPCKPLREFISAVVRAFQGHKLEKQGVLFVNHSLGGGTQTYQDIAIKNTVEQCRVYSINLVNNGNVLCVKEYNTSNVKNGIIIALFNYNSMTQYTYNRLLKSLFIDNIYINHVIGFNIPKFLIWNEKINIPYNIFIHDFFFVCPNYNLLNYKNIYCMCEKDSSKCNYCLENTKNCSIRDIDKWRESMETFLSKAHSVKAPSWSTKKIVNDYYPNISIEVKEHEIPSCIHKTYQKAFLEDKIKTVAVVGAIAIQKGVDILYKIKDKIEKQNLPIRLVVIGYTSRETGPYRSPSGNFIITGPYKQDDISDILAIYRVCLVLIPSIWPETFSYTTAEATASGYPVMVFNIGAPAERVLREKNGFVVPKINADAMLDSLLRELDIL